MPLGYGWNLGGSVYYVADFFGLTEFTKEEKELYEDMDVIDQEEFFANHYDEMLDFYSVENGDGATSPELCEKLEKIGLVITFDYEEDIYYLNLFKEETFKVNPKELPEVTGEVKKVLKRVFRTDDLPDPEIFIYEDK